MRTASPVRKETIMKQIILVLIALLAFFLLWKSQQKRLDLYDKWYMCMYEDWNHDRCNEEIYGKEVKR